MSTAFHRDSAFLIACSKHPQTLHSCLVTRPCHTTHHCLPCTQGLGSSLYGDRGEATQTTITAHGTYPSRPLTPQDGFIQDVSGGWGHYLGGVPEAWIFIKDMS